jgi:hypothetical protein
VKPLQLSGILHKYKHFEYFEVIPSIGGEFPELQVHDLLKADNSDAMND